MSTKKLKIEIWTKAHCLFVQFQTKETVSFENQMFVTVALKDKTT